MIFYKVRDVCSQFCSSLKKRAVERPNYPELLEHPFITRYQNDEMDVAGFVQGILDEYASVQ